MIIFIIIIAILYAIIAYTHPWIDKFKDYRDKEHTFLWYTNYKGERKYFKFK